MVFSIIDILCFKDIFEKGANSRYLMVSAGILNALELEISPTYRGPVIPAITSKYQGPIFFVIP